MSEKSLEILKPGLMTSIQDMGRSGLAYYAIPTSGAMDKNAAQIALLLLNLPSDFPVIECTSVAPEIVFHSETTIAISGANFNWKLNNEPVQINSVIEVQSGDVLGGKFARDGMRGYIALDGKLKVNEDLGSVSTYVKAGLGGLNGGLLKKGDILTWSSDRLTGSAKTFIIYKGPEYDWLSESGKKKLCSEAFKIGSDTDRMGMRLNGSSLESRSYQLEASAPILPGFIQLPPSGLPIIVLQDGQTTGGYPRIAYLKSASLNLLNQIPLGKEINFMLADG